LSLPIGKINSVVKVQQNFTCEIEAGLVNNYWVMTRTGDLI
jgi:hypothetical protein